MQVIANCSSLNELSANVYPWDGLQPLAQSVTRTRTITYADSGVDIERANRTKQRIKYLAHKTFNRGVLSEIGGFGGLFAIDKRKYTDPVLVSSVDGVGTKLKIAFEMNLHHTVGADLVNHCVNDIAVQGAAPMFFMDYFATGKLAARSRREGDRRHRRCLQAQWLRLNRRRDCRDAWLLQRWRIRSGGIHRRRGEPRPDHHRQTGRAGRRLVGLRIYRAAHQRLLAGPQTTLPIAGYTPESYVNEIKGKVGTELMSPHRSYWPIMRRMIEADAVSAMAHITGGGITENLPRVFPKDCGAIVEINSWPVLPIFEHLQKIGNVPQDEMLRTFNMGIGMILVVPAKKFKKVQTILERCGEKGYTIGRVVKGDRKVIYQ